MMAKINPPIPSDSLSSSSSDGHQLMTLLKRMDKTIALLKTKNTNSKDDIKGNDTMVSDIVQEIVQILQRLLGLYQRKGLLQGNVEVADNILASSSTNSSNNSSFGRNNNNSKKRNGSKRQNNSNNSKNIIDKNNDNSQASSGPSLDVHLVLSSILRIVENKDILFSSRHQDNNNESNYMDESNGAINGNGSSEGKGEYYDLRLVLIGLVADICTACCQSIVKSSSSHQNNKYNICTIAEYELFSLSGKSLMSGFENQIRSILQFMKQQQQPISSTGVVTPPAATDKMNDDTTTFLNSLSLISVAGIDNMYDDESNNDCNISCCRYTLMACMRSAASLVCLFGTKLSRSTALMNRLQQVGWETLLFVIDDNSNCDGIINTNGGGGVTKAAAYLLSSLPLSGIQNRTPCQLWNQSLMDCTVCISSIIEKVIVPTKRKKKKSIQQQTSTPVAIPSVPSSQSEKLTTTTTKVDPSNTFVQDRILEQWFTMFSLSFNDDDDDSNQESSLRLSMLLQAMTGLKEYMIALLSRDCFRCSIHHQNNSMMLYTEIDVDTILALLDTMLTYPSKAESLYYGTKKRLRNEVMKGLSIGDGQPMLCPTILAGQVANQLKVYGFQIYDSFITSVGSSGSLLPYTRRIMNLVYQALLSSSSSILQRVVDPTSSQHVLLSQHNDSKKNKTQQQRWLHRSIPIRCIATESFRQTVLLFGIDPSPIGIQHSSSSSSRIRDVRTRKVADRAITIICGCIVEELSLSSSDIIATATTYNCDSNDDDWGILNDRIVLVSNAFKCLGATLKSGGEYLSLNIRAMIDSVISTYLLSIGSGSNNPIFTHTSSNLAIFEASIASLCTPCQDGSSSSIVNAVVKAANLCRYDNDMDVVTLATTALGLCQMLASPRAPALVLITKTSRQQGDNDLSSTLQSPPSSLYHSPNLFSASSILGNLQDTKSEMDRMRSKAEASVIHAKKQKKDIIDVPDSNGNVEGMAIDVAATDRKMNIDVAVVNKVMDVKIDSFDGIQSSDIVSVIADGSASAKAEDGEGLNELKQTSEVKSDDYCSIQDPSSLPRKTDLSTVTQHHNADSENDEDMMPMIIDCGPDDDDDE